MAFHVAHIDDLEHLRTAFERDPRSPEWAQKDDDVASVREELPR